MDIKRPKNITDAQWEQAKNLYNTAKEKGDRYPELTVAQAALETGWFKHPSGKFNYFGQKATKSQKGTVLNTKEASNNTYYKTQSKFRDYESIEEAVDDRLKKWGSKYKDAKNVEEAIGKIWRYDEKTGQGKGYATDINYGNKIKSILNTLGFDTKTSTQSQTKPLEYKNVVDIQAPPETQGIIFSGQDEEPIVEEKESIKASQRLNEKSFLEELQQRYIIPETIQPVQYSQTDIQPTVIKPIEYNPIQTFQNGGGIPISSNGVYDYPNQKVIVPTNGEITMKNVDYPILGRSLQTGEEILMQPGKEYFFKNTQQVLEIPYEKTKAK